MGIVDKLLRVLGCEIPPRVGRSPAKDGWFYCPLCDDLTQLPSSSGWMLEPPTVGRSFSGNGELVMICRSDPVCENCVEKAKKINAIYKAMLPEYRKAAGLIEE